MNPKMAKNCWRPRRRRLKMFIFVAVVGLCDASTFFKDSPSEVKKREIYREGVLPSRGGVIPQGAFAHQRLKHNIHDSLGVEAPDGVLFLIREPGIRPGPRDPEDEHDILTLTNHDLQARINFKGVVPSRPQPTTYLLRRPASEDLTPFPYANHYRTHPPSGHYHHHFPNTALDGWQHHSLPDQLFISHLQSLKY